MAEVGKRWTALTKEVVSLEHELAAASSEREKRALKAKLAAAEGQETAAIHAFNELYGWVRGGQAAYEQACKEHASSGVGVNPGGDSGGGSNTGGGGSGGSGGGGTPPPQCSDGQDNDGDGFVDGADPVCDGTGDDSENGTSSKTGTPQMWGSDPMFPPCPPPSASDEERSLYVEIPSNASPPPPTTYQLLHDDGTPFASGEKICGGGTGVTETYTLHDPPATAPVDPPSAGHRWVELEITTHNPMGSGNPGGQMPTVRLKLTWGH
jgi:hypothetical protein